MVIKNYGQALVKLGWFSLILGLGLLVLIFWPVAKVEVGYQLQPRPAELVPVDTDFGIVIPKIGANARVIANVDPYNSRDYQRALAQGVAQAKGSSLPGWGGNIFIFSHSSVNFYEAQRYNSIFYLLDKLTAGDEVKLYYQGQEFRYLVDATQIVPPAAVNYLTDRQNRLTLMTCWPPGTSYRRLLVIAKPVSTPLE